MNECIERIKVGDWVWVWVYERGTPDPTPRWEKIKTISVAGYGFESGRFASALDCTENPAIPPKPKEWKSVTIEPSDIHQGYSRGAGSGWWCPYFVVPDKARNVKCTYEVEK